MPSMTIVVAAIAALAILLIAVGIASSGGSGVSARLERYTSGRSEKQKVKPEGLAEMLASSNALASLNRVVEGRDFGANLSRELARADLKLKPSEFLAIWAAVTVGTPAAFFVIGFVIPSFGSIIALIFGLVIGFIVPRLHCKTRENR